VAECRRRLRAGGAPLTGPLELKVEFVKCAMHYHTHRLVDALQRRSLSVLNTF